MSGSKLLHASLLLLIAAQALALPTFPPSTSSPTIASAPDAVPTTLINTIPVSVSPTENETPESASEAPLQESIMKRIKIIVKGKPKPKKKKIIVIPKPKPKNNEKDCAKTNPACVGISGMSAPKSIGGEFSADGRYWPNGVPADYHLNWMGP